MHVCITGIRGIPAAYGGFETFAEAFALHLRSRGHEVTVYCQVDGREGISIDEWNGIRLVKVPSLVGGTLGTAVFDLRSILHSCRYKAVVLTLGYHTAFFNAIYRLLFKPTLMNMDGIEWKRQKWSPSLRAYLWANEMAGSFFANHLVADHPEMANHLARHVSRKKITVIPYGADVVAGGDSRILDRVGVRAGDYYLIVARPEPENSILEMVSAYAAAKPQARLLVLGAYRPDTNAYHRRVIDAASDGVLFAGAIYEKNAIQSLRYFARAYIHGHQVGGTNPSLVEALAAGNPVIARDNRFNRWVAGDGAMYFRTTEHLVEHFRRLETDPAVLSTMAASSREQHRTMFTQEIIMQSYEGLLLRFAPAVPGKQ